MGPMGPQGPEGPPGRTVPYRRTVHVSPVPGDPAQSGNNLVTALWSIADAGATNPYLVKLEPGIYEVDHGLQLTVVAEGGESKGIVFYGGQAEVRNSSILASSAVGSGYGLELDGCDRVAVHDSTVSGTSRAAVLIGPSCSLWIGGGHLVGTVDEGSYPGLTTCVLSYDDAFTALDRQCRPVPVESPVEAAVGGGKVQ